MTLDLGVVSSSPTLGCRDYLKIKSVKKNIAYIITQRAFSPKYDLTSFEKDPFGVCEDDGRVGSDAANQGGG